MEPSSANSVTAMILLTPRPWSEGGSCSAQDFFLSMARLKPSLSQIVIGTLCNTTCDVDLPKAVETLINRSAGLKREYCKTRYYVSCGIS